jgi:hypothetical protein
MQLFNIEIQKNTSYELTFNFVDSVTLLPIDVTGCTASLTVRPDFTQPPAITLSTSSNNIYLGGVTGAVVAYFSPADTVYVDWVLAPFSLTLTDISSNKSILMKGFVTVVNTPFSAYANVGLSGIDTGAGGTSVTVKIPYDQAYYLRNTGPTVGASDSYFASSNVDWSA